MSSEPPEKITCTEMLQSLKKFKNCYNFHQVAKIAKKLPPLRNHYFISQNGQVVNPSKNILYCSHPEMPSDSDCNSYTVVFRSESPTSLIYF